MRLWIRISLLAYAITRGSWHRTRLACQVVFISPPPTGIVASICFSICMRLGWIAAALQLATSARQSRIVDCACALHFGHVMTFHARPSGRTCLPIYCSSIVVTPRPSVCMSNTVSPATSVYLLQQSKAGKDGNRRKHDAAAPLHLELQAEIYVVGSVSGITSLRSLRFSFISPRGTCL